MENTTITKVCGFEVPQKNIEFLERYNRTVPGFSPYDHCVSKIDMETGKSYMFMPINDRAMWFHMLYPKGKIMQIPVKTDEHSAIIETRLYENRADQQENYIANGFAMCRADESEYGFDFYSKACSYSMGSALTNAGFNIPVTEWEADTAEIGSDIFAPPSPTPVAAPSPTSVSPEPVAAAPEKKTRKRKVAETAPAVEVPAKPISAFYTETQEGEAVATSEIPVIKVEQRNDDADTALKSVEESQPANETPTLDAKNAEPEWDKALKTVVEVDGTQTPLGKLLVYSPLTVETIAQSDKPEAAAAKMVSMRMKSVTPMERMGLLDELCTMYGG